MEWARTAFKVICNVGLLQSVIHCIHTKFELAFLLFRPSNLQNINKRSDYRIPCQRHRIVILPFNLSYYQDSRPRPTWHCTIYFIFNEFGF